MATITKTKSGSFKAIIRKNGRTIKTKTFKFKKDARTWATRIEGDRDAMAAYGMPGASIPYSDLANEYMDQYSGRDGNIQHKSDFWKTVFSNTLLVDIDAAMIRQALERYGNGEVLRSSGIGTDGKLIMKKTGKKRSPATVNRMRAFLSSVFRYAIKQRGYMNENPCRLVPSLTENNKRVRYLSDDERKRLIEACKASEWDKLYLLVLLAITTGARLGELQGLHWNEINFSSRTATLPHTKNGDSRILTFPPVTITELQRFREVGKGLVFASEVKWRKPFDFRKHWNKALKQASIENFKFHDLRHTCASYLAMNGATLHEIAQVLGHRNIQTTMRYAHLSVDHKQSVTDRVMGGIEL
ncbi:tyrosine-type recombinase/integrase [Thiolapillus sp.]